MRMSADSPSPKPTGSARPYQPPRMTFLGNLVDVVQSGGGKMSQQAPDGPDLRKPPGK